MHRSTRLALPAAVLAGLSLVAVSVGQPKPAAPKPDAKAAPLPQWVWAGPAQGKQTVYLRKTFKAGGLGTARLQFTADNSAKAFLNGVPVGHSGDWNDLVTRDVVNELKRAEGDEHVLAIEASNEGGPAGVIARLSIDRGWGSASPVLYVGTDASWKASASPAPGWEKPGFDDSQWPAAAVVGPAGSAPWGVVNARLFNRPAGAPKFTTVDPKSLKVAKGFSVERLYSVPADKEGSWVSMCLDPKGRLIVCDQYGGLFRVTLPPVGTSEGTRVEKIPADIGEAQGLLCAFGRLYVVVNGSGKYASGLYEVTSSKNDDTWDTVRQLRKLEGGGEHGPHAVMLTPDGKDLVIVCGNQTKLTKVDDSRVPLIWGEDHLLPRMPDGRGFMVGVLAPGGCIYRVTPDGKSWTLMGMGFRNQYDAAYNRNGDLFTYDADMEWDMNTPWYRPTRVNLVASGGEFGWRNGAGKWPAHYPDSLGAVVNVGPGSPTGVTFGYGAKFPAKYQDALFLCDWSYGKLYAAHLTPEGSGYTGTLEEFVTGTPLPLTDLVVNPADGALYFAVGGRKTQSALYRVTYTGTESTAPIAQKPDAAGAAARAERAALEALHAKQPNPAAAVERAFKHLGSPDRHLRYAARVVLEHQDAGAWRERALAERDPVAATHALIALARKGDQAGYGKPDPALQSAILAALDRIPWDGLGESQRADLLRAYGLCFTRMGEPSAADRERVIARFDAVYPGPSALVNVELSQVLAYLQAPSAAAKTVALMDAAPTQEEQIDYARSLRVLKAGWTPELRTRQFSWFLKATQFKGGNSFGGFMANIKRDAVATLTPDEARALKPLIDVQVTAASPVVQAAPRAKVREWKLGDLESKLAGGLTGRDFERGRTLFGAANCYACHRYAEQGGAQGPDLTGVAGRFGPRDLLESILNPNKEISDQYAAVEITTSDDQIHVGRIINLAGDGIMINTNMLDPNAQKTVDRKSVESIVTSKVSMMPAGLLDTLDEGEILDLMAYLLSRGDKASPMFTK